MAKATSILIQARTEGGSTDPPIGSPGASEGIDPRSAPDELTLPTNVSVPKVEELTRANVLLANQPPDNVAFLHVQSHALPENQWAFSLLAASSMPVEQSPDPEKPRARPDLVLANLAQDVDPATSLLPSAILSVMRESTKENRDVAWWINELRVAVGDNLYLVVDDHTGFEIPWELLTLPESQSGPETFLGVAVSTARWQDIYDDRTFADLRLPVCEEDHLGHVAAYVDVQALKGGGTETGILTELHAAVEQGLKQLEDRLTRPEAGFGLIYLACHGHWAPSLLNFVLGSSSANGERLVLGLLQAKQLRLFEQSKAVVFINACHSGRMFKENKYLNTDRLRGFPELFLGKGAAGVIGTTGFVNDQFATKMADWLLRSLRSSDEPVSKLLRQWRTEVIKRLPSEPQRSEHDRVELLNAFMYVYYGNPLGRLRIVEGPS
jgi:hypothetical protein